MSPFYIIISSIGGSAVLFAALSWLAKNLITQLLNKDIEKFKSELKFRTDIELSQFKSNLELAAHKHQLRFSHLHEKRAKTISELYCAIFDLRKSVGDFIDSIPVSNSEMNKINLENVWKNADRFKTIYGHSRIYFDESVCSKVEKLNYTLSASVSNLASQMNMAGDQNWDSLGKIWMEAQSNFDHDVPIIQRELEKEFRTILGVDNRQLQ